jgi:hypothetical protein
VPSDNDMVVTNNPDKLVNQISLYAARGTLIESEGPTWLYGTGSEHTVLYQYQIYGAKDVSAHPPLEAIARAAQGRVPC